MGRTTSSSSKSKDMSQTGTGEAGVLREIIPMYTTSYGQAAPPRVGCRGVRILRIQKGTRTARTHTCTSTHAGIDLYFLFSFLRFSEQHGKKQRVLQGLPWVAARVRAEACRTLGANKSSRGLQKFT